jgi:hypothetical protein
MNPQCEGGYAGILDMLGNAIEWSGECSPIAGGEGCRVRGSSFLGNWPNELDVKNARDNPSCAEAEKMMGPIFNVTQGSSGASLGFRCCADEVR